MTLIDFWKVGCFPRTLEKTKYACGNPYRYFRVYDARARMQRLKGQHTISIGRTVIVTDLNRRAFMKLLKEDHSMYLREMEERQMTFNELYSYYFNKNHE